MEPPARTAYLFEKSVLRQIYRGVVIGSVLGCGLMLAWIMFCAWWLTRWPEEPRRTAQSIFADRELRPFLIGASGVSCQSSSSDTESVVFSYVSDTLVPEAFWDRLEAGLASTAWFETDAAGSARVFERSSLYLAVVDRTKVAFGERVEVESRRSVPARSPLTWRTGKRAEDPGSAGAPLLRSRSWSLPTRAGERREQVLDDATVALAVKPGEGSSVELEVRCAHASTGRSTVRRLDVPPIGRAVRVPEGWTIADAWLTLGRGGSDAKGTVAWLER